MKTYIERAAVETMLENAQIITDGEYCGYCTEDVSLDSIPTADVVKVRHGYWKPYEAFTMAPSLNGYPCSECGMHFSPSAIPILKYCPNCGALMDGKEVDHDKHPSNPV